MLTYISPKILFLFFLFSRFIRYGVVALASVSMLVLSPHAGAQSASCSIWGSTDFYEYGYTLCGGPTGTTFNISVTETIFHPPISITNFASAGLCNTVFPLSAYPADVYGKQKAWMTIVDTANPTVALAECDYMHIHARAAATELVLDRSGSMTGTKLAVAKTAAQVFIDTISPLTEVSPGTFRTQHYGVVLYNNNAEYLDIEPFIPFGEVKYEVPSSLTNGKVIDFLQYPSASGSTSIGAGLRLARMALQENLTTDTETLERPAILLLTDGKENTSPSIADEIDQLIDLNYPVYAIGFGEDYQIDEAKLISLSTQTGGKYRHTNDPEDITKFFMEVLVDNYANTSMILDPKGSLAPTKTISHNIPVSSADKEVIVILTWRNPANDLDLALQTPNLEISPARSSSAFRIIDRGLGYLIYSVRTCQQRVQKNCVKPDEWTATIKNNSPYTEHYSLTALSRSVAKLRLKTPLRVLNINDPIILSAELWDGEKAIRNAKVTANISSPRENIYHHIAKAKIAPGKRYKHKEAVRQQHFFEQKANLAYGNKPISRKHERVSMLPDRKKKSNHPSYRTNFSKTRFPGSYDITIRAEAKLSDGTLLVREATGTAVLVARPTSKSKIKVKILRYNKTKRTKTVRLEFTPIDANGDLVGIGHSEQISLGGFGKRPSKFMDMGNGKYRTEVEIPTDWRSLRLQLDDFVTAVNVNTKQAK